MDIHSVHDHITELQNIFGGHRTNAEEQFSDIMKTASEAADHLNVLISVPRQISRQAHRQNYRIQSPEEYYRVAIYVPYLDSLTLLWLAASLKAMRRVLNSSNCIQQK
ncbi:hypothetical protein HPB48_023977 [Haemaphysalis longicornis]|uniref:Uncharacterized protein n=1 Tax=Haemaphysalis longicornis TaxID=44386 RepID=A0A9J6GXD1_HAELO|nr:hypothetical protein HPB48_023977 [Haemaphysalis longicornis]